MYLDKHTSVHFVLRKPSLLSNATQSSLTETLKKGPGAAMGSAQSSGAGPSPSQVLAVAITIARRFLVGLCQRVHMNFGAVLMFSSLSFPYHGADVSEHLQTGWANEIGVTPAGAADFTKLVNIVNRSRVPVLLLKCPSARFRKAVQ